MAAKRKKTPMWVKRAAMAEFLDAARAVQKSTGVPLTGLGHWLQYQDIKMEGSGAAKLLDHDPEQQAKHTPEWQCEDHLDMVTGDHATAAQWMRDVAATGRRWDPDYRKPYMPKAKDK
jgi:hypothetical protein